LERLRLTEDGSHSLYNSQYGQHYHSTSGAVNESMHIYMRLGLLPLLQTATDTVRIFEMGFGTGLNAFLSWQAADQFQKPVEYTGVEAFPVSLTEAQQLNYAQIIGKDGFMRLHTLEWSTAHPLSNHFIFRKEAISLLDFQATHLYDIIFYDAFDPAAQPELWTEEVFQKIAAQTRKGGVLVTYSSKGIVKRALAAAGFAVEKHRGPGKKWHVLKAIKQ
jgi:tRNA U34 5-methylaminomethyl-2-thiouridine-forming methyltransferase MnmC